MGKQMRINKMPATLRLSKSEQERLHKKCIEINKKLIKADQLPVTESELAHTILDGGLNRLALNINNQLTID
jgi:hypothetical protein